jgi:hypothetical protein
MLNDSMAAEMESAQSPDELADEVVACVERTLSVSRAWIELARDWTFTWPQNRPGVHRRGGLLRPVGRLARTAGRAVGKAAWRRWTEDHDPGHLSAEGIIEPPARRHMIDFGSYAEIYKDGERWGGRSGRSLATLAPWPADRLIDLWWLMDVLRGTTAATVEGQETLRGARCRRIAAQVDLGRASALTEGGLHVPSVERFEDLSALPLTVWIDGQHVCRVRFREGDPGSSTLTLDLVDLDPDAGDLDWGRLPTFRSPEEAAYIAGEKARRARRPRPRPGGS